MSDENNYYGTQDDPKPAEPYDSDSQNQQTDFNTAQPSEPYTEQQTAANAEQQANPYTEQTANPYAEQQTDTYAEQPTASAEQPTANTEQQREPQNVYSGSAENTNQTSANDYNDFSKYNDYVNNNAQPESPYSPYNSQPYHTNNSDSSQNNSYYSSQYEKVVGSDNNKKKKSKGFKGFVIALIAVVVCVAIVLGVYPLVKKSGSSTVDSSQASDSTQLTINETPSSGESSESITSEEIAAKAEKFNVGVKLYGQTQTMFSTSSSSSLVGEGSGIIMGTDSSNKYTYIITCAHVISSVTTSGYTMTIVDYEGNSYDGIMVGYDSKTDVGVVKIEATGLTAAEFGDSTTLKKGQTVYAIGNPGGSEFFGSFTKGMISAIDRPINSESGYEMKCIQHTTPINSGNSGGALMNEYGQVIGINSSKIVSTGYEGMAFSIPISDAKTIIDDIIANGYVTNRPKLGITYASASSYQQYAMVVKLKGLPSGSLIISSIKSESSFNNTNVKVGDLIISVDGEDLDTADVLLDKVENSNVGDTLKLGICRINSDYSVDTFTVDVTLIEDTGSSTSESETTTQSSNSYDWSQFFGSSY